MENNINKNIAMKVSFITIVLNVLLTVLKLFAGIVAHSSAMISDSIHSLSDVLSTFIVIIGIQLANKKADSKHPYGHERFECVAALLLAIMLFAVGIGIGMETFKNMLSPINKISSPGIIALVAAIISIVTKELMYWYTIIAAKKINSGAMRADAWHHRSDALSSIGSFIGILGARLGFKILDPIASIIICLFILKVSIDIFIDAIDKMIDKSCSDETINKVLTIAKDEKDILNIDDLKTRKFGNKAYIDIEISVDKDISVINAHKIAEDLHDKVEKDIPNIKHCMVHVNPYLD